MPQCAAQLLVENLKPDSLIVTSTGTPMEMCIRDSNTWDPALAEEMGEALGKEAHDLDVNVLLGPGLKIKRCLLYTSRCV